MTIRATKCGERSVNAVATGATPSGTTRRSTNTIESDCNKASTASADRSTRERAATESETVRTYGRTSIQVTLPTATIGATARSRSHRGPTGTVLTFPLLLPRRQGSGSGRDAMSPAPSAARFSRYTVGFSLPGRAPPFNTQSSATQVRDASARKTWSTVVASTPHANGG